MLDRRVKVKDVQDLGAANYLLTLSSPDQARLVHPGQFLMLKCCEEMDENPLLRRPFSIFAIHHHARTGNPVGIEILVKDIGFGTHKLVQVKPGKELYALGPQGRPFHLAKDMAKEVRFACLVAGGVGIAALYLLARELMALGISPVLFYGARTAGELVLRDYFEASRDSDVLRDGGWLNWGTGSGYRTINSFPQGTRQGGIENIRLRPLGDDAGG